MNEVIYLEPDVEITSVIEKIKATKSEGVVLALPRGSTLAHSIVNLKLLKRTSESIGRFIVIAANDKIAHNLASQVGLPFYAKVADAERAKYKIEPKVEKTQPAVDMNDEDVDPGLKSSIKVRTYNKFTEKSETDDDVDSNIESELSDDEVFIDAVDDADEIDVESYNVNNEESDKEDEEYFVVLKKDKHKESPKDFNQAKIKINDSRSMRDQEMAEELEETLSNYDDPNNDEEAEDDEIIAPSKKIEPKRGKIKFESPIKTKKKSKLPLILSGVAVLVILVFAGLYYLFIPYITVSITVKTASLDQKLDLTVNRNIKEIDTKNAVLPGQMLENEQESTQTFEATGQKDVGEKATGVINVYNLTSDILGLSAGTKVTTKDGLNYVIQTAVKVLAKTVAPITSGKCVTSDGGQSYDCNVAGVIADVAVTASATGEKYNVATLPDSLTVGGFSLTKVYGQTKAGFAGGTTKIAKVVTEVDLAKADLAVRDALVAKSKQDLLDKATTDGAKLVEDVSQEIVSLSASKKAGEEVDNFDYKMKLRSYATGFSEKDLRSLATTNVENSLPTDQMLIGAEKAEINYTVTENNSASGTAKLAVDFVSKTGTRIVENNVKSAIKNKQVSKIGSILNQFGTIDSYQVKIWPKFMPLAPFLEKRIFIKFDYSE